MLDTPCPREHNVVQVTVNYMAELQIMVKSYRERKCLLCMPKVIRIYIILYQSINFGHALQNTFNLLRRQLLSNQIKLLPFSRIEIGKGH